MKKSLKNTPIRTQNRSGTTWMSGFMYSHLFYTGNIRKSKKVIKEDWQMKGYNTSNGYMGYVDGKYLLFASDTEYFEFMED